MRYISACRGNQETLFFISAVDLVENKTKQNNLKSIRLSLLRRPNFSLTTLQCLAALPYGHVNVVRKSPPSKVDIKIWWSPYPTAMSGRRKTEMNKIRDFEIEKP